LQHYSAVCTLIYQRNKVFRHLKVKKNAGMITLKLSLFTNIKVGQFLEKQYGVE